MTENRQAGFPFTYKTRVSDAVRSELLDTIGKRNAVEAEALRLDLEQRDVPAEFEQRMKGYGLLANDVADAMLGYWLIMWQIVHDRPLPEPGPEISAARRQMLGLLGKNPIVRKADDGKRQMLGEAMIYESVLSDDIYRRVKQGGIDGEMQALRDSTHHNLMQRNLNLKAMNLTEQGFVRSENGGRS